MKVIGNFFTLLCFIILILLSLFIQSNLFLNWDICWLMQCANRLIHGGNYIHDFLEINPPMIIFIYLIPLAMAKLFFLNWIIAFRLFMYSIALLSLWACRSLLIKLALTQTGLRFCFLMAATFAFLIFPTTEFGQRENVMMIFTLPYFLLVAIRCEHFAQDDGELARDDKVHRWQALLIGVVAGLGFAIKPYFLVAFILTECYFMWHEKRFFSWIRSESLSVGVICILYLFAIYLFTPDYFTQVLPMLNALYLHSQLYSWPMLFVNIITLLPFSAFILFILYRKESMLVDLLNIIVLAMFSFFIAYLLQEKIWFYHTIPMCGFAFLVTALILPSIWRDYLSTTPIVLHRFGRFLATLLLLAMVVGLAILMMYARLYQYVPEHNSPQSVFNRLISFTKQHAGGGRYYYMSSNLPAGGVINVYANVKSASRFPHMWPLPGIVQLELTGTTTQQHEVIKKYSHYMRTALVEDFERYKPTVVIIDIERHKMFFSPDVNFNYLTFFKKNAQFAKLWENYQYAGQIGHYSLYTRRNTK